ncbi:MAG: ATP-grasp fold amidoligase family protein [Sphingomicrobium sp.]
MTALTLARPVAAAWPTLAAAHLALFYRARHGRWPRLAQPQRFTEWVQWRKLHDRDAGRARLTDKLHGKAYAAAVLGQDMVVPTLWHGRELPVEAPSPMPLMVKANHGCGQFLVVRTAADWQRARALTPRWVAGRYGAILGEHHYRAAVPGLIVEPFLITPDPLPLDYKIYVFGGRAAMVQLHEDRAGKHHRWSQFDRHWRPLSNNPGSRPAPASLAAMIAAAERLAAGHDFLRVDFYEIDGRPLFGEFCLFPGSGLDRFDPVELDDWLGQLWREQAVTL